MIIVTCGLFSCAVVFVVCPAKDSLVTKKQIFFFGGFWGDGESDGLKWCPHKVISAQCPECQSGANSNKRGCGPPVKAQATARVDVPTARVFPAVDSRSPTRVQVFVANAWICAQRATDRDLESFCCECLDMRTAGNRP